MVMTTYHAQLVELSYHRQRFRFERVEPFQNALDIVVSPAGRFPSFQQAFRQRIFWTIQKQDHFYLPHVAVHAERHARQKTCRYMVAADVRQVPGSGWG